MGKLSLRLVSDGYRQRQEDGGYKVLSQGDEFEATSQAEYDRLTRVGALGRSPAVPSDAPDPDDPSTLKGDDLQAALKHYGLDTEGRADEKRARIAAHLDANPDAPRFQPGS